MKKIIVSCAIATALLVSPAAVFAGSAKHETPGTPGTASCEGQTRAYVAQALVDFEATGLGRAAKLGAVSVKQVQAEVAAYCNS